MKVVNRTSLKSLTLGATNVARMGSSRSLKLLAVATILGAFDGLQAKYMTIGNIGEEEAITYQVAFMLVSLAAAYVCLREESWSPARNLSNLLMTIPVATLADNISIDVQALRPYLLLIPKEGFLWRIDVFGNTFLSPVASWVNQQSLAPGLINGYAAAVGICGAYLALQYFWVKGGLDSRMPWSFQDLSVRRFRKR